MIETVVDWSTELIVSYKLKLPNDIPPSHRGKAIRFNYSLVVGTQRAAPNSSSPATGQGHIVQVPFRVLNHVAGVCGTSYTNQKISCLTWYHTEDGSRPIYDLMNPVVLYKDEAIVEAFSEEDFKRPRAQSRRMSSVAGEYLFNRIMNPKIYWLCQQLPRKHESSLLITSMSF